MIQSIQHCQVDALIKRPCVVHNGGLNLCTVLASIMPADFLPSVGDGESLMFQVRDCVVSMWKTLILCLVLCS